MAGAWLESGVTLNTVMDALVQLVAQANILPAEAVYPVLDDEVIPPQYAPHKTFITIRHPPFSWEYGDVFGGTSTNGLTNISNFILEGQLRVTLWMSDQTDTWGRFDTGMKAAIAPAGGNLLQKIFFLLWEKMLVNANGDYLLKRCLRFVDYEPPGAGSDKFRPFRLTYELTFKWDLTAGA